MRCYLNVPCPYPHSCMVYRREAGSKDQWSQSWKERITELGKWDPGEGEDGEGGRVSWKMQCHTMLLSEASMATGGFPLSAVKAESLGYQSPTCAVQCHLLSVLAPYSLEFQASQMKQLVPQAGPPHPPSGSFPLVISPGLASQKKRDMQQGKWLSQETPQALWMCCFQCWWKIPRVTAIQYRWGEKGLKNVLGRRNGSVGEGACCQAWHLSLISRSHMVVRELL